MSNSRGPVVRRHSLLKRRSKWSRARFLEHYEFHHGPLAANQPGFRKFATRYIQNHVIELPDDSVPRFDGITITTQRPREDYTRGFFSEPDYETVRVDEEYLFDLDETVSLLGTETIVLDGVETDYKAVMLTRVRDFDAALLTGSKRLVLNRLELETATALGFGASRFDQDLLVEAWFGSEQSRTRAFRATKPCDAHSSGDCFLPVREVIIYGPEKPWAVQVGS
jgi:hypothetical protein